MDAIEQLKQDVRDGRISVERLIDIIVTQQRQLETALREYERRRIPRTAAIIRNSWQSGRILQLDAPMLEALRNWLMGTSIANRLAIRMFGNLLTYRIPLSRRSA